MLGKNKYGSVRFGLLAGTVLLTSLTGAKVAQCVFEPKRAEGVMAYAAAQDAQDPNRVQPFLDRNKEAATILKDKNLFVVKPPKSHPVKQVDGILGREALIGGKWYKVGDTVGDAEIIAVEPTQVMIAWNGEEKGFAPLAAINNKSAVGQKVTAERGPDVDKGKSASAPVPTQVATVTAEQTVAEDDPLAWLGVDLPPRVRAMILEKWNSASDEEKQQAKDRWNSMSESEKEEAIRSFEERS